MKRYRFLAVLMALGLVAAACGRSDDNSSSNTNGGGSATTAKSNAQCEGQQLQATEVGVTADTITIQVMADTGSSLAPGLFQGNVDALKGFEKFINDNGGIACRKLVVNSWDSKLSPDESKNGLLQACTSALAAVGGNSLFNPDVTTLNNCADKAGQPTGLPNLSALSNDINEQCNKNTFTVQGVAETCPPTGTPPTGSRPLKAYVGQIKYYQTVEPNLKGIFMVPGDLPTTVQSATYQIKGQEQVGVDITDAVKVSGRDEQSAFTPKVQLAKSQSSNYIYNGSNDVAMQKMRAEAQAQNLTSVKVWACSLACYTDKFKAAGATVDGTYTWMQFLPFEDKGANQELDNYLNNVAKPDSFGAQAWQAAVLFQQAVQKVVDAKGVNGITRAELLNVLNNFGDFDANGWMGPKPLKGMSDCHVVMQLNGDKFERKEPTDKGKLNCNPANIVTVTLDPAVEAGNVK